ncbi:MAG: UDP-N-acetylglucosamine 2-epimerase (non-hydrolyzing) [Tannerellaceae bacterium]|jgi:UDP-GlcNAc3NAcA epimerase|nr:UDP-N-acetylglucosamine 2-epimerase (non-hydrolyzing) [Tannerellaceae bacterium]
MKLISIVGARPQFIKAAMFSRAIQIHNTEDRAETINEQILHTGQHYDSCMSEIFFNDLGIPRPTWMLDCAERQHGRMTGRMLIEIEEILLAERPDYLIVYGDTNSTLAGALAACKLHIPIVHIEAGLRSFNREMPEEINRILVDHASSILCCPTYESLRHLSSEGITKGVHHVGDIMYDAALFFSNIADKNSDALSRLNLKTKTFRLCTIHRAENTDNPERLAEIIESITRMAQADCPVVFPVHPRTEGRLRESGLKDKLDSSKYVRLLPPLGFLDMVMLEKHAKTIITDSGGIQKEAYFHRTPCITLRDETEWTETVAAGWNTLAGHKSAQILSCLDIDMEKKEIPEYGTGRTASAIIDLLV